MDLKSLNGSLHELHSASLNRTPLVASPANRLYDSSKGWGKIWSFYYRVVHWITKKDKSTDAHAKAARAIDTYFRDKLSEAASHARLFLTTHSLSSRKFLISWTETTHLFHKWAAANGLYPQLTYGESGPFLKQCRAVFKVEEQTETPLPYAILKQCAVQEPLSAREVQDLDHWIKKTTNKTNVRVLHQALRALFPDPDQLACLELHLQEKRCSLLTQRDEKHLRWRNSIQAGAQLSSENESFTIEERMGGHEGADNTAVFTLAGNPKALLVSSINEPLLSLKNRVANRHGWGLPHARFLEMDPGGKYALVERLKPADGDRFCKPLANWIRWCIEQGASPKGIDASRLLFNEDGEMRTTKAMIQGAFDYCALEKTLYEASKGDAALYSKMMRESGLARLPAHSYFRRILEILLQRGEVDPLMEASRHRIEDPRIVERGERLLQEVQELKARFLERSPNGQELFRKRLLKCYNEAACGGRLFPHFYVCL